MLYIHNKKELVDYFNSVPLEKKMQLYRSVRSVVAMLVKVSKMTEIYPVHDKIYDEFAETLKQNIDVVHNNLPYASVTTKKVGFYFLEKKIKLFDKGERKFRNIFLVNEIRQLYFVKGITIKEIRDFFAVIQETLNYTLLDYDFNTRLWDYGITHIGTLSDPDMGDPEPWNPKGFDNEFDPLTPEELFSMEPKNYHDMATIVPEFDNLGKEKSSEFTDWSSKRGKDYVVKKYLEKSRQVIIHSNHAEANRTLVNKICEYTVRNIQNGDFISGLVYVDTLVEFGKEMKARDEVLFLRIKDVLKKLNNEDFIDQMFSVAAHLETDQIKSFGQILNMLSTTNFDVIFMKLVGLESRDVRLHCLEGVAKNFKDASLADKYIHDEDWHVVRNILYMLRFAYNPDFLPFVRDVMNHPVRQIRVEAARVLSMYDADENFDYWSKAVFSPDEEIRLLAVETLLKVKGIEAKHILDDIFKPKNRSRFNLTDFERYMDRILSSERKEFHDLPGSMIFSENRELRLSALRSLNKIEDTSILSSQIIRRLTSKEFLTLELDESELLLSLIRGADVVSILDKMEYVFCLKGGFFSRKKYVPFKKKVFNFLKRSNNTAVKNWLQKASKVGNKETVAIVEGRI